MKQHTHTRTGRSSRRVLLRWLSAVGLILALGLFVAACGDDDSDSKSGDSGDAKSLNIMTWETYHDQAYLDEFKKQTGIEVKATNVGSPAERTSRQESPRWWP